MDEEMIWSASQLNHACHALIGSDLIKKGTNLIPTIIDTANIDCAIDSVTKRVDEALCTLIQKPSTSLHKIKTPKIKIVLSHSTLNIHSLYWNNNTNQVSTFTSLTTSTTQPLTLNSFSNPPTFILTLTTVTATQTGARLFLHHGTGTQQWLCTDNDTADKKTWGGLLYPPNGSKRSMTDTFQTFGTYKHIDHLDLETILHKPNYILTKLCTQFTTYLNTDPYKSQKTITWQRYKGQHTSKRSPAWNFYPKYTNWNK